MLAKIDFTKYQKMNERQKFNALLKEKKDIENLKEKIKFKKSVIGYLQGELNFFLEQEFNDELKQAIKEVNNGEVVSFDNHQQAMEYLNDEN